MAHQCERCGSPHGEPYQSFELESWDISFDKSKNVHYICFPCFDKLTEARLQTDEVKQRMRHNREQLEKLIEEGLVCPQCKEPLVEGTHTCPEH